MVAARRDRWFLGEGLKRTGPLPFEQLVQLLLGETDPRAPLVWHKGFASWTRAEDIPQVERRLALALVRASIAPSLARTAVAAVDEGVPGSPLAVYGGLGLGVIALGLAGWLLWPRPQPPAVFILPAPEPTASSPVPVPSPHVSAGATVTPAPPAPPHRASAFEDREAELPPAEVRRLRGVAAWSGETLGLTVENRTSWRVTELRVRVSRTAGDELVPDAGPLVLLPPAPPVAPGVAELMDRVAPDRKRPGLNPLDTGSFEAKAGPRPAGYRFEIESARGYAPR
jgi:hypothetical protein